MSRFIALAAVAAAVLLPGTAHAAATSKLTGVVVSKETARHALVVTSAHGKVTTVRTTPREVRTTPLGARVSASGTKLADGSLHATSLTRSGARAHALIHVTVVKAHRAALLVAGGGSLFSIRLNRGTHVGAASRKSLTAGQQVNATVTVSHGHLVGSAVKTDGQSVLIDFSGKVTALDATSLTVTDDGESTVVTIPDGVTLPALVKVGTEVEIVASVSGSTLTLVEIKVDGDGAESGDDGGSTSDGGTVRADGFVTALDASSITIQPGDDASPLTFAIPAGFTLPAGLAAGSKVEARGDMENDVLTLTKLEMKTGDGEGDGDIETQGTVTALDSGSITIQPAENGTPLTFAIPDGFTLPAGLQVGSLVEAKGDMVNSVLTLTKLKLEDDGGDGGGD